MVYDVENYTITTDRLILRMFSLMDAARVAQLCNNEKISVRTLNLPYPYTAENAETWIKWHKASFDEDKRYEFAVTDKLTGELYGCVGLGNDQRFHHGEIGYWFGEEYWGRGYATEAARAVIEFAFTVKHYHRVYAHHFAFNPASGRVMQKAGMTWEGVLKEHVLKNGQYVDLVCYGIVNK